MLQIDLSVDDARFVEAMVQSGAYADPTAAVKAAIRLLRSRHELRQKLLEAMASDSIPGDEVFAEIEQLAEEIERDA